MASLTTMVGTMMVLVLMVLTISTTTSSCCLVMSASSSSPLFRTIDKKNSMRPPLFGRILQKNAQPSSPSSRLLQKRTRNHDHHRHRQQQPHRHALARRREYDVENKIVMTRPPSLASTSSSVTLLQGLQELGLSTIVATILVAALQAGVALLQYRTNPQGQLAIPPGPTVGVARPQTTTTTAAPKAMPPPAPQFNSTMSVSAQAIRGGSPKNATTTTYASAATATSYASAATTTSRPTQTATTPVTASSHRTTSKKFNVVQRLNRFLFLLLPWFARNLQHVWSMQTHLLHVGVVLSLVRCVDSVLQWGWGHHGERRLRKAAVPPPKAAPKARMPGTIDRVMVLGDSLAVGLGSIERFEARVPPEEGLDYWLIENTKSAAANGETDAGGDEEEALQSPVFPPVLASTLAQLQNATVAWRSAGVDGGAVPHVRQWLLPVLKQEVEQQGQPPNVIVVLCGMNDLKLQFAKAVTRPWRWMSARAFRRDLHALFEDISDLVGQSPTTTRVIIPAMPVQMFLKNTVVGIFPLSFLLDVTVGYWECQKQRVVRQFAQSSTHQHNIQVEYLPLSTETVKEWYERDRTRTTDDGRLVASTGFVAADGIHPNAKCYQFWAEHIAQTLLVTDNTASANESPYTTTPGLTSTTMADPSAAMERCLSY